MGIHTQALWGLARDLLRPSELQELRSITVGPNLDYSALVTFDQRLLGPSLDRIECAECGHFEVADRQVFRPLQYCAAYLTLIAQGSGLDWLTRAIVHMSSLHIESLVKNIGQLWNLPLGAALGERIIQRRLDVRTLNLIRRFTRIYNSAKHDLGHPKDTHLFSLLDAIVAYILARKLGMILYPLANLATDLTKLAQPCTDN